MITLYPRVVCADRAATLTLTDERGRQMNGTAIVTVQSMEKYNVPHTGAYRIDEQDRFRGFEVVFTDGRAQFDFTFSGEQRHRVFCRIGEETSVFEVYSLKPDLYALNPYKGDTHIHSTASDGRNTPDEVAEAYYAAGYDYIALTDHHVYRESAKLSEKIASVMRDFYAYPGEEVHNRGMGYFHIINFGAEKSVNELINADPDRLFAEVTQNRSGIAKKYGLPEGLDKSEFAFRLWVSEKIRESGGVSVLCHPYWDAFDEYNMQTDMLEFLLKEGIFDAFEVCDDDDRTGNGCNLQTAMYEELRAAGYRIPVVGASDCHNVGSDLFGKFFTYAFCEKVSGVKEAVKDFRTVAVERIGSEFRVHGPFRLVKYTRFLVEQFEPGYASIKAQSAKKLFDAVNRKDPETVRKIEDEVAAYRNLFFGKAPCDTTRA